MFSTAARIPYTLNLPGGAAAGARRDAPPDHLPLLQLCTDLREVRRVHALMVKSGEASESFCAARLVQFYAVSSPGSPACAEKLLFSVHWLPSSATFAGNTAMRGHLLNKDPLRCVLLFLHLLLRRDFRPDTFTFTVVLKAATRLPSTSFLGEQLYSQILRRGLLSSCHVRNKLIHLYCVAGDMAGARKVFDGCPSPDAVAWNSMLQGYAAAGDGASLRQLFDEMPGRDVVAWNTMIVFFSGAGEHSAAVEAFREMQLSGVTPDRVTLIGVLSALAQVTALGNGKWVHAYILRRRIELDDNLLSALIAMYAKCGSVEAAAATFAAALPSRRGVDVWNAMISALVSGGFSGQALRMLAAMEVAGISPDAITFACLLSACNHGGLVEEGEAVFKKMAGVYRVEPDIGHYGAMVDLFCRAGMLQRAEEMISEMPMEPDAAVWRSVLWASRRHGRSFMELGMEAGRRLLEMEPEDHAGYVMVSNLLAMDGRWGEVAAVRREMRKKKVRKVPGCSAIELDGAVHEFIAGD